MRLKTDAKIYAIQNRNGSITYRVDLGKDPHGKRIAKGFSRREDAEEYKKKLDGKLAKKVSGIILADINEVERHEILGAREKLKPYNATIAEAVEFFIKHNATNRVILTVEEALEIWKAEKAKLRLSQKYQFSAVRNFFNPFIQKFRKRKLNDIMSTEIDRYIFSHRKWNAQTRASHISYLRTFFSFFVKRGNISLNPAVNVQKPKVNEGEHRLLSVEDTSTLLNFALDNESKEECAAMVLTFFCGMRVEEVSRLTWAAVDLDRGIVTLQGKDSKKGRRRINPIPENAKEWLKRCYQTGYDGRIGPSDYAQRLKRLRTKVKEANKGFVYPQNAMRHSFAGYHLAKFGNAATTAVLLGHPNPSLLYSTYKELSSKEEAEKFWNIVPMTLQERRNKDEEERKREEQSLNQQLVESETAGE